MPADRRRALALLQHALHDPTADFRAGQWEAIEALVDRQARLLLVRRTGWGKSLVYFMATRLLRDQGKGPALLISPLLALMRDQVAAANKLGVHAATLNSSNTAEWTAIERQLRDETIDVLIVSPERLANERFSGRILAPMAERIGLLVVDEAHCISDWGHDFRPDYQRITRVLQALPANIPVLATTATANNRVIEDIVAQVGRGMRVSRGPLGRTSLHLQTITMKGHATRLAWLAGTIPTIPGSGIVYTLTQRDAQQVAAWLRSRGIDAHSYHGGSDTKAREALETRLLDNRLKVLVATSALGMGFDKPDLAFVIHYQRPGSVVHYYQQVGRAGRKLDNAYGVLLGGDNDEDITEYFLRTAFPPQAHVRDVLDALGEEDGGLVTAQLKRRVNLSDAQLDKVLKLLRALPRAPVVKRWEQGKREVWYATPVPYTPDLVKIERLTHIRRAEQQRMLEYLQSSECLMRFLARELDDPNSEPCGHCAVCRGEPILPTAVAPDVVEKARSFLLRSDVVIKPLDRWEAYALRTHGWKGGIDVTLQAREGRALSRWGDDGWGNMVRAGKQADRFDDALIAPLVALVRERWRPRPYPTWVTCVPSLNRPTLVPDLARKVAAALELPFVPCVRKLYASEPQKRMQNDYQRAHNLDGVFAVAAWKGIGGPVLLIDDMVDSRWTFTVAAALLRAAGCSAVFPLALSDTRTAG
jgi:ATP-dependent DNA helicase RecQ